ncbi:hypothetical protein [Roseicella sp. DB1501]|uniref:hypothetical protein n=1 Tax=Roseicella sp. DB1501 TaxID=2730925 RepID=UPI001491FD49|nr:hypothetical protein [Roseicella sp. DB1501]
MEAVLKPREVNSLSALADRLDAIKVEKAQLANEEKAIEAEILGRYESDIADLYKTKGDAFGAVNLTEDDLTLSVTVPKKVEWDQDKLAAIHADIRANGADPAEYMTVEYGVPESKYKAWPVAICQQFEPARTVTPGRANLVIKRKGGE